MRGYWQKHFVLLHRILGHQKEGDSITTAILAVVYESYNFDNKCYNDKKPSG